MADPPTDPPPASGTSRAAPSLTRINPTFGENMNLHGLKMRVVQTAPNGVVGWDTILEFAQVGNAVTASYSGGRVGIGPLVGILKDDTLSFRYCQISDGDQIDGGSSNSRVEMIDDGRLRLIESFDWESRDGGGVNILEETMDCPPNRLPDRTFSSGTAGAGHQPRRP
jgi:hypothetical protein